MQGYLGNGAQLWTQEEEDVDFGEQLAASASVMEKELDTVAPTTAPTFSSEPFLWFSLTSSESLSFNFYSLFQTNLLRTSLFMSTLAFF